MDDPKTVQGLSLEEARRKLEEMDRFEAPKYVHIPPVADQTAQHVIERRRLKGKHLTKEVVLSLGIVSVVTYFAWFFLRAQAHSTPRPAPPEPEIVAPAPPPAPPIRVVAPAATQHEPSKPAKPAARPKPAPAPEPTEEPEIDPLLNRTFRK